MIFPMSSRRFPPLRERARSRWQLNSVTLPLFICFSAAVLFSAGCSKKADVKSQTAELEKAFPSAATAPDLPGPVQTPIASQTQPADPNSYVKAALTAVRSDDYAGSVIALQTAQQGLTTQQKKGTTAEQLMAIENAKQAITAKLVERAARGDEKAKAELARIERTRSQ